jgi:hypothetical protein
MTVNGWLQIGFFALAVLLITKPMGLYLLKVYDGSFRWLAPVERGIYRVLGVDPAEDQHWTRYAGAMLLFAWSRCCSPMRVSGSSTCSAQPRDSLGAKPAGVRDRGVVHDEHELAVVQRRA